MKKMMDQVQGHCGQKLHHNNYDKNFCIMIDYINQANVLQKPNVLLNWWGI